MGKMNKNDFLNPTIHSNGNFLKGVGRTIFKDWFVLKKAKSIAVISKIPIMKYACS